jgi:hypothetical protein
VYNLWRKAGTHNVAVYQKAHSKILEEKCLGYVSYIKEISKQ